MGANSSLRRVAKRLLRPLTNDFIYSRFQALAMAWDIRSGNWREPELRLLPYALRSGETALDVGANFGVYCYHLSRAVGLQGKVFGFEPIPFTFGVLSNVRRLLGMRNVQLFNYGCSNAAGEAVFSVPLQDSGGVSAGQAHIGTRNDEHSGKEKQVRWKATREVPATLIKLDDFLAGFQVGELSLIKCDTEGAEFMVFQGAAGLLDRFLPTVILEINPWFLEGFGIRLEQLLELFLRRGYEMYRFKEDGGDRLEPMPADQIVEDNYVFIHPRFKERFTEVLKHSAVAPALTS
jgi:FkbM family methyltransferase